MKPSLIVVTGEIRLPVGSCLRSGMRITVQLHAWSSLETILCWFPGLKMALFESGLF